MSRPQQAVPVPSPAPRRAASCAVSARVGGPGFTAIDFETANHSLGSPCAGIVVDLAHRARAGTFAELLAGSGLAIRRLAVPPPR